MVAETTMAHLALVGEYIGRHELPQAKGRVALQNRLITPMRVAGIASGEAGNAFLTDNDDRFARAPKAPETRTHPPLARSILCLNERNLSRQLTCQYRHVQPRNNGACRLIGTEMEICSHLDDILEGATPTTGVGLRTSCWSCGSKRP